MIEEVVNSILEAEDVAKQRIADAEQKAGEIVSAAEMEAERLRKQAAANNKAYQADKLQEADDEACKQAKELLSELNAQTDEETKKLRKRVANAVKIIVESI